MARAAKPQGEELLGRLTRSAEFQALRRGHKFEGKFGRMRAVARPPGAPSPCALRIGLIVPGKLGNAPQRNRIKRRLREGMRRSRAVLTMDFDALAKELEAGVHLLMRKLERRPI
jgi:ribonuclease P protein component